MLSTMLYFTLQYQDAMRSVICLRMSTLYIVTLHVTCHIISGVLYYTSEMSVPALVCSKMLAILPGVELCQAIIEAT